MNVALIGQGGHSKVIFEMLMETKEYNIIGIFDDKYQKDHNNGERYYGPVKSVKKLFDSIEDLKLLIAIGDNRIRKSIFDRLQLPNNDYLTFIHSSAYISPSAKIGSGTVVMPLATINTDTIIGEHSIINTNAVIEHNNLLGKFTHASPNATLTGGVKVGDGSHIGAGAVVIPNKSIDSWSVIGAGSVVIDDIPSHCTAVGVPARIKKTTLIGGV